MEASGTLGFKNSNNNKNKAFPLKSSERLQYKGGEAQHTKSIHCLSVHRWVEVKKSTRTPSWRVISHKILASSFSFRDPNTRTVKNNADLIGQYEMCDFFGVLSQRTNGRQWHRFTQKQSSLFQVIFYFLFILFHA